MECVINLQDYVNALQISLEIHVKIKNARITVLVMEFVKMETVFAIPGIQEMIVARNPA